MKKKKFSLVLSFEDLLDITLYYTKGKIIQFALNYRTIINENLVPIYRIDNYHGFLHEQKFWRSNKPIPIKDSRELNIIVKEYKTMIINEYEKYKRYYKDAKGLS